MFARFLYVLLLVSNLVVPQPGVEKAETKPEKFIHTKVREFKLPIVVERHVRANLANVQLFAKFGDGDWVQEEVGGPFTTIFTFRAPADGKYFFTLVTVDKTGKQTPKSVREEPPGLRVIVDTEPPTLNAKISKEGGDSFLRVTIIDANPDPDSIKVRALLNSGERVLTPIVGKQGVFRLTAEEADARLEVTGSDLAGNSTSIRVLGTEPNKAAERPSP